MATVVLADRRSFDGRALHAHVSGALPAYARPLFLRVTREIDVTGTLKQRKLRYREEGFDPGAIPSIVDDLSDGGMRGGIALHTSGAHGPHLLDALAVRGVSCGVLHPLQTIADPELGVAALQLLGPQPGELILDLGCGDGTLTAKIAEAGARVIGVNARDLSTLAMDATRAARVTPASALRTTGMVGSATET